MSDGKKQFKVYRLKRGQEELEALWHRSWAFIQKYHIRVISDHYEQICESPFSWNLEPEDIRRQLEEGLPAAVAGEKLEISDVLVITKEGVVTAYYVDLEKLVILIDFFYVAGSAALLTIDTSDYQIEGRIGTWLAVDETWIEGQHFFLMQNQKYGTKAKFAVVDSQGRQAADDTAEGLSSDTVLQQLREFMARQYVAKELLPKPNAAPPLENWQKSYENGEYLRSAEMAEEQNYSMIDGRMNNMPPKSPAVQHQKRKRRKGKLPLKGRESVLKRLREYQDQLSEGRGQPDINQDAPEIQERRKT